MGIVISESGMQFGEYEQQYVYQLEKSSQYTKKLRPNGIKSCEFIMRRDNALYFAEAKTTCPQQIKADTSEEKKMKYNEYIQDIVLKMRHSLALYSSILLGRYDMDGIPEGLRERDTSHLEIKLVLVVKNAKKEWLIPFQEVFRKALKDEIKIWQVSTVNIINEQTAREKHFIL